MFKACDKDGNIVSAVMAKKKEYYCCRICGKQVSYTPGDLRYKYGKSPHFRHFPKNSCSDTWHYYDKTQWHKDWQDCFPVEEQEVILELGRKKHIADVFIEEQNTVIEFQHSYISPEEFKDRNDFYNSFGYKVIWVFDIQKCYTKKRIGNKERGYGALIESFYWDSPIKCLRDYQLSNSVDVFLQISGSNDEASIEGKKSILLRVSRSDAGFKTFYAPAVLSKVDFLAFVKQPDDLRRYRLFYSKEELEKYGEQKYIGMDIWSTKTVLGCPLSSRGENISFLIGL